MLKQILELGVTLNRAQLQTISGGGNTTGDEPCERDDDKCNDPDAVPQDND
ncbi:hypothetical protein [Aquimarina sp. Aq78]|uniref:hypothetical protein n=1 Tax=Aquimarina sp. Aq78 TaxID=1191889 RepID=UPI00131DADF1|nr:hypothetical protein [Aquimarina sp. Aq78]